MGDSERSGLEAEANKVKAGCMPAWDLDELPEPPPFRFEPARVVGPGLLMVGAAIGGGEWLMGPAVTAQYGGAIMWVATLSILLQCVYNLEVMRYTLWCGENIFVGFFRTLPGPTAWILFYLIIDVGALWPYLASNAAVPLVALYLGRAPVDDAPFGPESFAVRVTAYFVFLASFLPLLFGGKVYNALMRVMFAKVVYVLVLLTAIGIVFVKPSTWGEIFLGFVQFGRLPTIEGKQITWSDVVESTRLFEPAPAAAKEAPTDARAAVAAPKPQSIDLLLLASFAAIAGVGGMNNSSFSSYVRDKGWGMGQKVGAIPSFVGGKGILLSHTGRVFHVTEKTLAWWKRWRWIMIRDQLGIWVPGCILGVGIPALISLEFVQGAPVGKYGVAAMTADGLYARHPIDSLWYLMLFCGFLVLAPSQVSNMDGLARRWTDVIWTGWRRLAQVPGDKVFILYYFILALYLIWGLFVLTVMPEPLTLVKLSTGLLQNFALGVTAFHTLVVNCTFLPKPLRPGYVMRLLLIFCGVFFIGLFLINLPGALKDLSAVLR